MSGHDPRRRALFTVLKLGLGLAIMYAVFSKLHIRDQVDVKAGDPSAMTVIEGTLVENTLAVSLVLDDGSTVGPFSWDKDEVSYWKGADGASVLATKNGRHRGKEVQFDGHLTLRREGQFELQHVPFSDIAFENGGTEEGLTEQLLKRREGLLTIFRRLSIGSYALALLSVLAMYLFGIKRWQVLLRAQGLEVSYFEATRLTFIGFFFNNIVPGMTGGDVIKAVLIARAHKGRGPDAVATVIVDRILGLVVLAGLAAVVLLFSYDTYRTVANWVFLFLAISVAAAMFFLSRRVRRFLRIDRLMNRLPGAPILKQLDQAFLAYRNQPGVITVAIGLSILAHLANVLSVYYMGLDLGVAQENGLKGPELLTYMATVPIIMIVSSIPLLPGGWGLGEAAFGYFFRSVGIRNITLSVSLSVLHRFSLLLFSLVGGIFLLSGRTDRHAVTPTREEAESILATPGSSGSL